MASYSKISGASLAAHEAVIEALRDQTGEEPTRGEVAMALGVGFGEAMALYELTGADTEELTALIHGMAEQAYTQLHATAFVDAISIQETKGTC